MIHKVCIFTLAIEQLLSAHYDAEPRIFRLLCLLRLIVQGWPVPERLRRSVGRRMCMVPSGKLQRVIRRANGCASDSRFGLIDAVLASFAEKPEAILICRCDEPIASLTGTAEDNYLIWQRVLRGDVNLWKGVILY